MAFEDDRPLYERALLALEGNYTTWTCLNGVIIGGAGAPNMVLVANNGWIYWNDAGAVIFHMLSPALADTGLVAVLPQTTFRKNGSVGGRYVAAVNWNFAPRRIDVYSDGVLLWQRDPSLDAGVVLTTVSVDFSANGRYLYVFATAGLNKWHLLYEGS
jgi:hypothetical protein